MHLNNPWDELYENWPVRNNREAIALKLLSEGKIEKITEKTGMTGEELREFLKWTREYEVEHLCIAVRRDSL